MLCFYYKLGETYIQNAINAEKYNRSKRWKETRL